MGWRYGTSGWRGGRRIGVLFEVCISLCEESINDALHVFGSAEEKTLYADPVV
jgi:hypothetical protein